MCSDDTNKVIVFQKVLDSLFKNEQKPEVINNLAAEGHRCLPFFIFQKFNFLPLLGGIKTK